MPATDAMTDLKNDHRLIEAVLSALEKKLSTLEPCPEKFVARALIFLFEYADALP